MFWVIQNNIFKEQKHSVLMKTLREQNIPHIEVKVVPFYDKLLPSTFDSHSFQGVLDEVEEVEINETGLVMALGATSLMKIAKRKGWLPGSFLNENFHYDNWKTSYGEHLLNYESVVDTFRNIAIPWDSFFIRPCEDTKAFNGSVFTKEEFEIWRKDILATEGVCPFADEDVVVSPLQAIYGEYRFFVVDGTIVTYSQYKLGNVVIASPHVDQYIIDFAQAMVDSWQPARAFVIDIANTPNGCKVIEINNFNSAGFYDADIAKIINAIENMKYE